MPSASDFSETMTFFVSASACGAYIWKKYFKTSSAQDRYIWMMGRTHHSNCQSCEKTVDILFRGQPFCQGVTSKCSELCQCNYHCLLVTYRMISLCAAMTLQAHRTHVGGRFALQWNESRMCGVVHYCCSSKCWIHCFWSIIPLFSECIILWVVIDMRLAQTSSVGSNFAHKFIVKVFTIISEMCMCVPFWWAVLWWIFHIGKEGSKCLFWHNLHADGTEPLWDKHCVGIHFYSPCIRLINCLCLGAVLNTHKGI